jgi:hypothetical protein
MNADDGWDFINCQAAVTVEKCWSWANGYKTGSIPLQAAGNGNGFKVGGFGLDASMFPDSFPQHTVRFCLAFDNREAGFYQKHHPVANFYYNNTAFKNRSVNFNLLGFRVSPPDSQAGMGILRNNIALGGTAVAIPGGVNLIDAADNSWNSPSLAARAEDFQSTDTNGVSGKRQAAGALPDLPFLKLAPGSRLIDKGEDLKLGHNDTAPDLGAFESGIPMSLKESGTPSRSWPLGGFPITGKSTRVDMNGRQPKRGIRWGSGRPILLSSYPTPNPF